MVKIQFDPISNDEITEKLTFFDSRKWLIRMIRLD